MVHNRNSYLTDERQTPDGEALGFWGYGLFMTLLAIELLPGESEEVLQSISEILVFKRGDNIRPGT